MLRKGLNHQILLVFFVVVFELVVITCNLIQEILHVIKLKSRGLPQASLVAQMVKIPPAVQETWV